MSWASELPPELLCRPMGLVVLTGLDVTYNAIHKSIWDSFCNNRRPDRVPLKFAVLAGDHEYPKCRSKRTSYEWYIPKGVIKTSWMKKHLELVPAVVVLFFDLDWDENMWKERQMECATKVEIVRNSLTGRSTKVAVVLIQKNSPLPPGEDVVAAERAASLCSACDLSAKSLFVLPHTDHLYGYTIRLENAFYELAQSYYHTEARRVKAHKEFLNKTTHQLLFVRHQFKIAFFNELKQDTHTALKHYKQAYLHVLDLRMHDTNLLEVKTTAGFINYKICRLSFQHNAPLDSIAQFRKHIDFFKSKVGIPELAFEHSAWMSKQFQVFGDLFDEAIKLGLTAIQTQHPGFYYQQAANHSVARKQLCRGLCHPSMTPPSPDPLEQLGSLDYYGQRPWRQGHQSIDPPDALKERDGIQALQCLELRVDHSWQIIPLLSSAVAQFKKYKSPRMKRYLMVQMGEEYYHAKDYNKALSLLMRVTWDYRNERWWPLLTSILITSLRCAYLIGNIQEYVTLCLELIGPYTLCSPEEKTRVQMNLIRVMSNDPPEPEQGCSVDCVEGAKQIWKQAQSCEDPCVFTIEMQNIIPFVECKAQFSADSFTADSFVVLRVFLRANCQFPIRFSKLSVLLTNQTYNQFCTVTDGQGIAEASSEDGEAGDLYLVPGNTKMYTFSFVPQGEDVGKNVQISSIVLELGSETSRCAILHWTGGGGDAVVPPIGQQMNYIHPVSDSPENLEWDHIDVNAVARIEPRVSQMEITLHHEPPNLVNEFYQFKIQVKNGEEVTIENVTLSFGLKEAQESPSNQSTHVSMDKPEFEGKVVARKMGLDLGSLETQMQIERNAYIKSMQAGDRIIFAKVTYNIEVKVNDNSIKCACHREESLTLPSVSPFNVGLKLTSLKFDKLEAVHADEPFLLLADIECISPWSIHINTTELALAPYVTSVDEQIKSQLDDIYLNEGDCAGECCCLVAPPSVHPTVSMGNYTIHWKRKSDEESHPFVTTTLPLPNVAVEHIPLLVDVDLPAHGVVRSKLPITYTVYNRTPYSQEIETSMESTESFMFSGNKQFHFRVLPDSKHKVSFLLFPLMPGNLMLPRLHVNMLRYPGTMDDVVHKMLPTHIFVKPSGKLPIVSQTTESQAKNETEQAT